MTITAKEHAGARSELCPLFELAEDSASELDSYIDAGGVLVALEGDRVVGHLQLIDDEVRNMAVLESRQRRGIGRVLIGAAVERARRQGHGMLVVATAAADIGNLRFYQRLGFRMRAIERDVFTPANGYAAHDVGGIQLRDRVWLDMVIA